MPKAIFVYSVLRYIYDLVMDDLINRSFVIYYYLQFLRGKNLQTQLLILHDCKVVPDYCFKVAFQLLT